MRSDVVLTDVGVELLVDVNEDTRVLSGVGAGELHSGGSSRSGARNVNLEASWVELRATDAARDVESCELQFA